VLAPVRADPQNPESGGTPRTRETYTIDLKVIDAERKGSPRPGAPGRLLDQRLSQLAAELGNLPFEDYDLVDMVQKDIHSGEAFSMQFGHTDRLRFIKVAARGKQQDKVKLHVSMERISRKKTKEPRQEFTSEVSIPEGGTLVVVPPRKTPHQGRVILLAISAKTTLQAEPPPSAAGGQAAPAR
jgi:hypothetical protein